MSDRSDTRPGILPGMVKPDVVDMGFGDESRLRDRDVELLAVLVGEPEQLTAEQFEAFSQMLGRLREGKQVNLSERQRAWAEGVAEKLEIDVGDPAQRNANVPKGRPVELAPVLKHLPKKPPGRK